MPCFSNINVQTTMETCAIDTNSDLTTREADSDKQFSLCHNDQDINATVAVCTTSDITDYTDSIDSEECEDLQLTSNEDSESRTDKCCDCKGCRDYSTSNQPVEVAMSKVLHSHHSKEKQSNQLKSYRRKIQSSWYRKYPWITVCSLRYRIFCRLCCGAKQQGLLTNSDHLSKSPFINNGFANWKKALQRFSEHEQSDIHHEAVEKLAAKASSVHIGAQLSSIKATEMAFYKCMLMKVLSYIRYLGRQGLALRGHNESIESFEGN